MQLYYQYITRLPFVTPAPSLQHSLESIAHTGISGESVDTGELNSMVYDLYGLSHGDIALIDDWFERRSLQ